MILPRSRRSSPRRSEGSLARIDYLEGITFWGLVDERETRLREAETQAAGAAALLAEIDAKITRVTRAEAALASGVHVDFFAFQGRADSIREEVAVAIAQRETRLGDQIRSGIHREMAQVERQILVTRVAIARATDQLAMDRASESGP